MDGFEFKLSSYPLYGKISNAIINVHNFDFTIQNLALTENYFEKKYGIITNQFNKIPEIQKAISLNDIFGDHFKNLDEKNENSQRFPIDLILPIQCGSEKGKIDFNKLISEKLNIIYDNIENEILNIKIIFIQFLIDDINKDFGVGTLKTLKHYSFVKYNETNCISRKLYKMHIKNIKRILINDLKQYLFEILSIKKEVTRLKTFISLLFELDILDKTGLDYKAMEQKAKGIIKERNLKIFDHLEIKSFTREETIYDYIKSYRSDITLFNSAIKKAKSLINEFELSSD